MLSVMGGCLEKLFPPRDVNRRKGRPEIQLLTTNDDGNNEIGGIRNFQIPVKPENLIAIYDYESRNDEDLTFKKHDQFVPVASEGDWWLVRSLKSNEQGYVPCNFVSVSGSLQCEEWFYGTITRKESERLLSQPPNSKGSYLIRESETSKSSFSLSLLNEDPEHGLYVKHYRIHRVDSGEYFITKSVHFRDLKSLVKHYEGGANGLCCQLEQCCSPKEAPQTLSIARNVFEMKEDSLERKKKLDDEDSVGEIYECLWNGKMAVHVKTSHLTEIPKNIDELKKLHHRTIVKIFGVVRTEPVISLVWEYMSHGSLLNYLRKGEGTRATLLEQIDIAAQVASGMAYLESVNFPHRCLRAASVMVAEGPTFKVSDYGIFLHEDDYERSNPELRTKHSMYLWLSIETMLHSRCDTKADVWSFGVLTTEIVTKGSTPYSPIQWDRYGEFVEKIEGGYRMTKPEECPDALYELLIQCWDANPELRPTFEYIQIFLESFFQRTDMD